MAGLPAAVSPALSSPVLPVVTTTTSAVAPSVTASTTITDTRLSTTTTTTSLTSFAGLVGAAPSVGARPVAPVLTGVSTTTSTAIPAQAGGICRYPQKLHDAIRTGDLQRIEKRMQKGDRIFSKYGQGTLLELALQLDHPACVLTMLHHCGPLDTQQRDARLLDLFHQALGRRDWSGLAKLLGYFGSLDLRLPLEDVDRVFVDLVRWGQIDLARFVLEIGFSPAPTPKRLGRVVECALRRHERFKIRIILFTRLIQQGKASALAALQQHFGLSFCASMSANLACAQPEKACAASLRAMLKDLNRAAQSAQMQQVKMMCALATAGYSWISAENLIFLHGRILGAGLNTQNCFEQQCMLATALQLATLNNPGGLAWPGPQDGAQNQLLLNEKYALGVMGAKAIALARARLAEELSLELEPAFNTRIELGRRLQMTVGLPSRIARAAQLACRQVLQAQTGSGLATGDLSRAVAQAILLELQSLGQPAIVPGDPVSIWHGASWQILYRVAADLKLRYEAQ